jgi:hypothetical protein
VAVDLGDSGDAAAFLDRLVRLEPAAIVRLRPVEPGRVALWAQVPWGVLVTRTVDGRLDGDRTAAARALLAGEQDPPVLDAQWRIPLPPAGGRVVETLPGSVVQRAALAAAQALRDVEAGGLHGRAVGQRIVRDALLDHIVISGRSDVDESPFSVPQRLVQAVVRMGFLGKPEDPVMVITRGPWTALAASFGTAWFRAPTGLNVRPILTQPIG